MVRTGTPARSSAPCNCIRQLESIEMTGFRTGAHDAVDLGARHRAGDLGEFDRKGAAEPAAFFGGVHLAQLQSAHVREQPPRTLLDLELAQRVATVVIGRDAVESARRRPRPAGPRSGSARTPRSCRASRCNLCEALGVVVQRAPRSDGRSWRCRSPTAPRRIRHREKRRGNGAPRRALRPVAGVEGRLAAAGLPLGKVEPAAGAFEHVGHRQPDLGKQLIDDAGDKQRNPHDDSVSHGTEENRQRWNT